MNKKFKNYSQSIKYLQFLSINWIGKINSIEVLHKFKQCDYFLQFYFEGGI